MTTYLKDYLEAARAFDRAGYGDLRGVTLKFQSERIVAAAGLGAPEPIFHNLPDEGHEILVRADAITGSFS